MKPISNVERMTVQNFIAFLKNTQIVPRKHCLAQQIDGPLPLCCCLEGAYASFLGFRTSLRPNSEDIIVFHIPGEYLKSSEELKVHLSLPAEVFLASHFPLDWLSSEMEITKIISAMGWQTRLPNIGTYYCSNEYGVGLNLICLFDEMTDPCWQDYINLFTYLLALTPYS